MTINIFNPNKTGSNLNTIFQLNAIAKSVNLAKGNRNLKEIRHDTNRKAFMLWNIPQFMLQKASRQKKSSHLKKTKNTEDLSKQSITKLDVDKTTTVADATDKCDCIPEKATFWDFDEEEAKSKLKRRMAAKNQLSHIMSYKAERYLQKWLQTALAEEREAVLELLHKIRNLDSQDNMEKQIQDLLKCVYRHIRWDPNQAPHPVFSLDDGSTSLKHINLLTNNERRDRWMYKSWHHLPPYKFDRTSGPGIEYIPSHYKQIRQHQPIDFVFHPDMEDY